MEGDDGSAEEVTRDSRLHAAQLRFQNECGKVQLAIVAMELTCVNHAE